MNKETIALALALAAIPCFSFLLQREFSKQDDLTASFKRHWTCFYGDWIFVPFNLFWIYSIKWNYLAFYWFAAASIVGNGFVHRSWGNWNARINGDGHFYIKGTAELNEAGKTHYLFSVIETLLIFLFIFFSSQNWIAILEIIILFCFSILILFGSKKIHNRLMPGDVAAAAALVTALVIKLGLIFRTTPFH